MFVSSNNQKKQVEIKWGIEKSYFPFRVAVSPLEEKDLELASRLTPTQRLEWLIMIRQLLIDQFDRNKKLKNHK
jgi:hypothetical protein